MKKSEFKAQIKEEIIDILEAATQDDDQAQQDLNAELELSKQHAADLGDVLSESNDSDKFQDDGYVNHTYDDSVIDKYNVPVEPTAVFNEDATPKGEDFFYDYLDIGMSYLEGFGKKHSLDDNQLEKLGKKIVDQLYKGDVGKAYDAIVKRGAMKEDEDKEPSKAELKKTKGLAKAKEELALLTREMKSLAKKYSKAEGEEKEKLVKILKDKTKLKKELESILDK